MLAHRSDFLTFPLVLQAAAAMLALALVAVASVAIYAHGAPVSLLNPPLPPKPIVAAGPFVT